MADNAEDTKHIKAPLKAVAANKPVKVSKKGQFRSAPYNFPLGVGVRMPISLIWILIFMAILNKIDSSLQTTNICFRCRTKGHWHVQPSTEILKSINKPSSSTECTGACKFGIFICMISNKEV